MKVLALVGAALLGGCLDTEDELTTSETLEPSFVLLGNIYQNGTLVSFDDITAVSGIDMTKIVGLTACDPKALYAVTQTGSAFSLFFSNTSGQSWSPVNLPGKSKEIACDHGLLATLDANKSLWFAKTRSNGNLIGWYPTFSWGFTKVDRIQGGDGSFYGVKDVASGYDVYVTSNKSLGGSVCVDDADGNPAYCTIGFAYKTANIGATQVTGTGIVAAGTTETYKPGNTLAWSRRAFALETNGTISTNSKLLEGNNLWTGMNTGSERYLTITAAAPNLLYGIQLRDGVKHINRIRIDETTCDDGIDNDSNGLIDGEDPTRCAQTLATQWCNAHADGDYCADRYQPSHFLDQTNQSTSLVHCSTGLYGLKFATIHPGWCSRNYYGTGIDFLRTEEAITPSDPPESGRYCNVQWNDGTWGFSFDGPDPCATLKASKLDVATVVRAGLYSTTGDNHAFAVCAGGVMVGPYGSQGIAPLSATKTGAQGKTNCLFHVSAGTYPLFDLMWDPNYELHGDRHVNPFIHNKIPVDLTQFGFGEPGAPSTNPDCAHPTGTGWVDRAGHDFTCGRETAYDTALDEGRPLLAPANGVVMQDGSRIRDISGNTGTGTPNQEELYVRYSIGSNADYRETFVVYYAHVRKRLVVDGQTVRAGQILGYVGASGATGGFGHLHVGVFRTSNTNAHSTPAQGYHLSFATTPNVNGSGNNMDSRNTVDPLGWANGNTFDPWAYAEYVQGRGAWSPNLFKPGKAFGYY